MTTSRILATLTIVTLLATFTSQTSADICHEYRDQIIALEAA